MNFNEWTEYTRVGSTCEYDDRTNQFIEQYNNATFQTYMDNERKNRSIQRADQIRAQGGEVLPTHCERKDDPIQLHKGQGQVYPSVLRWTSLAMDKLREYLGRIN